MKKLITVTSLALLLGGPVFGQENPNADAPGMMTDEQVEQMQEHLREMQTLMDRVQEEDDPARRQELMREHMLAMREGFRTMGGGMMMGGGQGQGRGQGQARGPGVGTNLSAEERLQRMQTHMAMMQMMMGQMMQHMAEDSAEETQPD